MATSKGEQTTYKPFEKVLIANRGEIALRIRRACQDMGLHSVIVCSEADRDGITIEPGHEVLCIGPAAPSKTYLNKAAIVLAAKASGAQAIHPGYGFLSENAGFAEAVAKAGLVFIGPPASAIRMMGDKISAKRVMIAAGVPCVPGPDAPLPDDPLQIAAIAEDIGYPVIVKAAGGGGGRGMRVVNSASELGDAVSITREEASKAFGASALYLEKFLQHPRHVEFQVLCDAHGHAVWLGHRDCSLQRRHQKVVEEAPAPDLPESEAARVGALCAKACQQIGYQGVGTFEFLFEDGAFYFLEMNTRLQVEHPVTEETSGLDLVCAQIRAAQGLPLDVVQTDVKASGHAFECRINAENPFTFAASPGRIEAVHFPSGPGIRVDTHVYAGYKVSPHYDSLIAKLIVHGQNREEAMARMRLALDEMRIDGIMTNLPLHRALFADPDFAAGAVNIHHLERHLDRWAP
jgi:acetyl-CoA carboxylase biotin carboxylase subunit